MIDKDAPVPKSQCILEALDLRFLKSGLLDLREEEVIIKVFDDYGLKQGPV